MNEQYENVTFGNPDFFLIASMLSLLLGVAANYHGAPALMTGAALAAVGAVVGLLRWAKLSRANKVATGVMIAACLVALSLLIPSL